MSTIVWATPDDARAGNSRRIAHTQSLLRPSLDGDCAIALFEAADGWSGAVGEIALQSGVTIRYEANGAVDGDAPTWESIAVYDGARSFLGYTPRDATTARLLAFLFVDAVRVDFRSAAFLGETVEVTAADQCYTRSDLATLPHMHAMVWGHAAFYEGSRYGYEVFDGCKAMPRVLRVYHQRASARRALALLTRSVTTTKRDGRYAAAVDAHHAMIAEDCALLAAARERLDGFVGVGWESACLGYLRERLVRTPPPSFPSSLYVDTDLARALEPFVRPIRTDDLSRATLQCVQ